MSIEVMTASSTGRSMPPVRTLFSSSTTFLEASSTTSPKIVCLPLSHGVVEVAVSYTHLTLPTKRIV